MNKSKRKQNKPNKKILALAAVALAAAVCGIWLLTTPIREQGYVNAAQTSLIEDLMRDIYGADSAEELAQLDYNGNEPPSAYAYTYHMDENSYGNADYGYAAREDTHEYVADTTAYEPTLDYGATPISAPTPALPENDFPNSIIGIGILTIESINLRLPIAEGVDEATLRIAPGRVPQTAQIGDIGNAVIAGHRNYTFGSMFNRLGELEIGDIVQYQARNGEMMEFVVFEIAVIEPNDQIAFLQPVNDSIITLYTCTPIRTATHRLIIRAQRIDAVNSERAPISDADSYANN